MDLIAIPRQAILRACRYIENQPAKTRMIAGANLDRCRARPRRCGYFRLRCILRPHRQPGNQQRKHPDNNKEPTSIPWQFVVHQSKLVIGFASPVWPPGSQPGGRPIALRGHCFWSACGHQALRSMFSVLILAMIVMNVVVCSRWSDPILIFIHPEKIIGV